MFNFNRNTLILLLLTVGVTGCFDDDDDKMDEQVNSPPSVQDSMVTTQTEVTVDDTLTASDSDGDTLMFSLASEPMLGSVMLNSDGSYSYTPNLEVTGADSFTFSVSDGVNAGVTGTVNIVIEALEVDFAQYGRAAFNQQSSDMPLSTNGRKFTNDGEEADFDDLVQNNE